MTSLNPFSNQLLASVEDIVSNIELHSNFCIRHPDYQPFTLPAEAVVRFQKIPEQLKNKYLCLLLRNFLYGIYYNGSLRPILSLNANSANLALHQNLENNTLLGIDREFYERLHASNCSTGYFDHGWQVIQQETDGTLAVTKGGLTLHVERECHLQPAEQSATVDDVVAIRMPKNLVQNGFYVAVSNVGQEKQGNNDGYSQTGRIYFNLNPEGAVAVTESLTGQLNEAAIPFTFKVLYNPSEYGRYDSGVLYFECSHYQVVREVLQAVYRANRFHFQTEVPLFTKLLAPGMSLAEEPNSKFAAQESFGMNRCRIVANGLLEVWQNGKNSPEERMESIRQHFSRLGIELQRPYLNANSEDIYSAL